MRERNNMNQKPVFSIIIPVYNVEKYLKNCVESVINQLYKSIEIILIDDGSSDKSGDICDEYAKKDKRIKVIHKKNEGVSVARNRGIENAFGQFIMFLDSDDVLPENILSKIANDIEKDYCDIYTYTYGQINESGEKIDVIKEELDPGIYSKDEFLKSYYTRNKNLPWGVSKNVFKANVIKEKCVNFPVGIRAAEDLEFYMQYLEHVEKVKFSNDEIIDYRVNRAGSVMTEMKLLTYLDILKIYAKYANDKNSFVSRVFSTLYLTVFFNIRRINNESEREIALNAYNPDNIVGKVFGLKNKRNKFILKVLGTKNTFALVKWKLEKRGKNEDKSIC